MKNRVLATLGAAAFTLSMSAAANAQIISQPGESMGVALGAPLPEGVFFVDLESYGERDGAGPQPRLGVNIPLVAWSTPFSFYNTRLEVLYAAPFTHIDGAGTDRVDIYSQALLFVAAHDFGNGFNAALVAGPRTPDNFTNNGRGVGADLRASFSYVANGFNATATFAYSGNFGGKTTVVNGALVGFTDNIYVDYTLTKKFDKFELGVVGTAQTDIGGPGAIVVGNTHRRSVSVGGLIGYAFDKFTLQAMVTREVAGSGRTLAGASDEGYGLGGGLETRGWVRLIVPLYVAPAAPAPQMVRARY